MWYANRMKTVIRFFLTISLILSFVSCSKIMGYSVVLWSIPETSIHDGQIVPVYIKSNISQVYVIENPESKEKMEVPLWQITEPVSKGKAEKLLEKYTDYTHIYAKVASDGLPIRFEPVNTARQVYRLRKDEVVKVLYKGEGAKVMAGKNPLPGDWLRLITDNGTEGWCFSYNLRLFDETAEVIEETVVEENNPLLEKILRQRWYPDSYRTMIRYNRIDLDVMNPGFGFSIAGSEGQIVFTMNDLQVSYPFEGTTKIGKDVYKLNNTPLSITIRNEEFIVLQYIDPLGKPKAYNLITLQDDIGVIIENEKDRRKNAYQNIQAAGPDFSSSNYGVLQFMDSNQFLWSGYQLLSPSIIPANGGGMGLVSMKYFLDKNLAAQFDGILTFVFDGKQNQEVNFFYKLEDSGLRLENAQGARFNGKTAISRSPNPLIIFFSK